MCQLEYIGLRLRRYPWAFLELLAQSKCGFTFDRKLPYYSNSITYTNVPSVENLRFIFVCCTHNPLCIGGTVKIQSTNAFVAPLINPNMLDTEVDIVIMRESVRAIKRFISAPAWKDYVISPFGNLSATADADIDSYVRQHTTTVFHPSSTASMTSETSTNGVVNPDFTVKGVDGLRIVDLSVFVSLQSPRQTSWRADHIHLSSQPFIPSCHPQGPLYLVAERAADIIKGIVSTR